MPSTLGEQAKGGGSLGVRGAELLEQRRVALDHSLVRRELRGRRRGRPPRALRSHQTGVRQVDAAVLDAERLEQLERERQQLRVTFSGRCAEELDAALPEFTIGVAGLESIDGLHVGEARHVARCCSTYQRAAGTVASGRSTTRSPLQPSQSRKE